jgi:methylated-DNA-[protein]-cysteine S-methyltransferase
LNVLESYPAKLATPFPALASYQAKLATPFAVLGIRTVGNRLTDIDYLPRDIETLAPTTTLAARTCREIERYLVDPQYMPRVPFEYAGTDFQRRVWREISAIPAGRTLTYNDIARILKTAPRPVGGACGRNRLPIVIPCHRVLAAGGLGGFMGGAAENALDIKRWLLKHEGVQF